MCSREELEQWRVQGILLGGGPAGLDQLYKRNTGVFSWLDVSGYFDVVWIKWRVFKSGHWAALHQMLARDVSPVLMGVRFYTGNNVVWWEKDSQLRSSLSRQVVGYVTVCYLLSLTLEDLCAVGKS